MGITRLLSIFLLSTLRASLLEVWMISLFRSIHSSTLHRTSRAPHLQIGPSEPMLSMVCRALNGLKVECLHRRYFFVAVPGTSSEHVHVSRAHLQSTPPRKAHDHWWTYERGKNEAVFPTSELRPKKRSFSQHLLLGRWKIVEFRLLSTICYPLPHLSMLHRMTCRHKLASEF